MNEFNIHETVIYPVSQGSAVCNWCSITIVKGTRYKYIQRMDFCADGKACFRAFKMCRECVKIENRRALKNELKRMDDK